MNDTKLSNQLELEAALANARHTPPVPYQERFSLSIHEASEYFGLSIKIIRRLAENHPHQFALRNGNKYLIIRHLFEDYLINLLRSESNLLR